MDEDTNGIPVYTILEVYIRIISSVGENYFYGDCELLILHWDDTFSYLGFETIFLLSSTMVSYAS